MRRRAAATLLYQSQHAEPAFRNLQNLIFLKIVGRILAFYSQALWHKGFRYRLHVKDLPGKPDIVLPKYKTAIFVNGCFWHGHKGCKDFVIPKSNTSFWLEKIGKNKNRDEQNITALISAGWKVITIWECELKKPVIEATLSELLQTLTKSLVMATIGVLLP